MAKINWTNETIVAALITAAGAFLIAGLTIFFDKRHTDIIYPPNAPPGAEAVQNKHADAPPLIQQPAPPVEPPHAQVDVLPANMASQDCGGQVLSTSANKLPGGGVQKILHLGNNACMSAPDGEDLIVEVRLCPQAAKGIHVFKATQFSENSRGGSGSAYAQLEIRAKENGDFRSIGKERGSQNTLQVALQGDPLEDVTDVQFKLRGHQGFIQSLCGLDVQ